MSEFTIAGNSMWRLGGILSLVLGALLVVRLLRLLLDSVAAKFRNSQRMVAAAFSTAVARSLAIVATALVVRMVTTLLILPERFQLWIGTGVNVLFVIAVAWVLYRLVDVVDAWLIALTGRSKSKLNDMLIPLVRKTLKISVVVLGAAQVAQTLSDKPLTSIIASLGIGGLAVALAAQETVKNFFGSLVLLGDKPFELGDRVTVDGVDGIIETLGFRSTRIRTLDGHLVTFPNGELANKVITNISRRPYIRRVLNLAITYDTPPAKVARAVEILKEILRDHEGMKPELPPRVVFNDFNATSLNILVIYWYHPGDFWAFQAFNERINLEILRRFNEEGIDFAFPTQTLFLAGDPKRPLGSAPAASN